MESLERLRRYVNDHTNTDWEYATFPPQRQLVNCTDTAVFGLIDAIEQEHAELLNKALGERDDAIQREREVAYSTGYEAGFDEGLASTDCWSADDWTGQHEDAMAERGWVKLPVDADGEVIHIGDRMENNERVARIVLTDGSWEPSVYTAKTPNQLREYFCHEISHHHEPTVEDVLREFVERWHDTHHDDIPALFAEYAQRLRLAGDE